MARRFMQYISTRGQCEPVSFTEAVATGLAPDGGLYLPESIPDLAAQREAFYSLDYEDLSFAFFRELASGMDEETLRRLIDASYTRFTDPKIAPLVPLADDLHVLELFHGPTLAFKDFALQLVGNLYEEQIRCSGEAINVLGATSGDTGSAAIHGLLGKAGVNSFILYPDGRISPLQERQMTTTGADNVFPVAITGSFDDAQKIIKDLFGDLEFKAKYRLSAINSINLARILAQCVYYVYAVGQLPAERRENIEFIVPT
ncbi:MAG: threonine synthase, partial [Verrucomicrobiota bacterium]